MREKLSSDRAHVCGGEFVDVTIVDKLCKSGFIYFTPICFGFGVRGIAERSNGVFCVLVMVLLVVETVRVLLSR